MGQIHFAVLALHAHFKPASLGVTQVGAGADLKILALTGAPCLNIAAFDLQIGQIAGAAFQLAHGDVHAAEKLHAHAPHLFVPVHGILRPAHNYHFLLFKLVYAVNAPLLYAVGALLLAEAGGVAGESFGQLVFGNYLVDEAAYHGVLAGADKIEVLPFYLVHHGVHFRKAHHACYHVGADHKGRDAVGKALAYHKVPGVGDNGLVEPGDVAQQVIKAVAGHPARGVHVDAVEALHYLGVVWNFKIRNLRLAEALHLHIVGVVGAYGHAGVYHLGDHHHFFGDLLAYLLLQRFKLRQTLGVFLHLDLDLFRFLQLGGIFFALTHQHTDLL